MLGTALRTGVHACVCVCGGVLLALLDSPSTLLHLSVFREADLYRQYPWALSPLTSRRVWPVESLARGQEVWQLFLWAPF